MIQRRRTRFIKHGTLPQLAVLEALVRFGTLGRAAEELHMAQSTASGLIRKLEESAGVALLEKSGRYVTPTVAGRVVYSTACETFAMLRSLESDLVALTCDERRGGANLDAVITSSAAISLGVIASSETRKNGIPKPRVRAPRRTPLPHAAGCTAARPRIKTTHRVDHLEAIRSSRAMDETIDYSIVFAKTQKGVAEINARSGALTLQARRVLIMIDGRRPVAELMAVVRTGEFDGIISQLDTHAMIEKVDLSSLPARDFEAEDFADTISLLQENAAALRSMPHVTPADLAQAHAAAAPKPVAAEARVEASAEAVAIAARAVATASATAPNTVEAAMRRPPTISVASPMTKSDVASGTARPGTINVPLRSPEPSAKSDMASGSVRPGTINVPLRSTEQSAQRPPTLSGARPATLSGLREHANAAVDAPSRPAAPEKAAVRAEPARAEPVAAPAPAPAAAATRSFEEEKRLAVKELFAVLGPYGEQPVQKLQECTTMEALREQIKQAGKRVATFRGDKAAQDFLRSIGHG